MTEFNSSEFNQGPLIGQYFVLFLNPDTTMIRVAEGVGTTVPPSVLYPGSEYLLVILTSLGPINTRFTTPPAISYDGLGG